LAEKKEEKHQKEIRKIAEATAIIETIKSEVKNTEYKNLQQLLSTDSGVCRS